MAEIGIPKVYRGAFRALAHLDDDAASRLADTLGSATTLLKVEQLQGLVKDVFPPTAKDQAERLVPAILSLRGQLRSTAPSRLAEVASSSADLELSSDDRARLRARLEPVFASAALSSTANALELLTQHQRNYSSSRVVTDVRHVFPDDPKERPTGAVIVEVLQLQTWNRDGATETLYIAMDEHDLIELRSVMDRALDKSATLREMLGEQELTCFELDERNL